MFLKQLSLQNFRNYSKSEFNFSKDTTLVVGPNTSGKTNLVEAIFYLSTGKSFKGKDEDVILFGKDIARIKSDNLEVVFANQEGRFIKKYLLNGVAKQRANFVGNLPSVLFTPVDLEIVTASPGTRRNYLDFVLEQVDGEYRRSSNTYQRAIRNRNRLLENAKKIGGKDQRLFDYWDNLIIANGDVITKTRASFIDFINNSAKDIFDFYIEYDKSVISKERLSQYKEAELAAAVTLIGPHRDDFCMQIYPNTISPNEPKLKDIRFFGSRGQQRLAVLQLKLLELEFVEKRLGQRPILLLDDILSELDEKHIKLVLEMVGKQQTIITTTHKEFVQKEILDKMQIIDIST